MASKNNTKNPKTLRERKGKITQNPKCDDSTKIEIPQHIDASSNKKYDDEYETLVMKFKNEEDWLDDWVRENGTLLDELENN